MAKTLVKIFLTVMMAAAITTDLIAQTTRATPITVGEMAPDFTLEDHHGRKTTLSESRGKSPVVLVFYRGYW